MVGTPRLNRSAESTAHALALIGAGNLLGLPPWTWPIRPVGPGHRRSLEISSLSSGTPAESRINVEAHIQHQQAMRINFGDAENASNAVTGNFKTGPWGSNQLATFESLVRIKFLDPSKEFFNGLNMLARVELNCPSVMREPPSV